MGIATSGLIRAEGNATTFVLPTDLFVIQRYQSNNNGTYYVPYEASVSDLFGGVGFAVTGLGTATFNGSGSIAVAMATITAGALVFATEHGTGAAGVSVAVTAGTGFTLTSSNSSDASVVNYIVYDTV